MISQVTELAGLRTKKKFELWDKVLNDGLLETEPEAYWGFIKTDPTIFAYHFFKDDEGNKLKLYPWQDLFVNDPATWKLAVNSRQVGKTSVIALTLLHKAYFNPNQTLLVISATKDQVKELVFKINNLMNNARFTDWKVLRPRRNDSSRTVQIKNKGAQTYSRIISVPATDAARGYAAHMVVLDELAFMENASYILNQVAIPTTSKTGGEVVALTTPNGQSGPAWEIYKGEPSNGWKVFNLNWTVNPHFSPERMEMIRRNMTWSQFSSEYEARFEAGQNSFFNQRTITAAIDPNAGRDSLPAGSLAVGVDFGKHTDPTVMCVGKLTDEMPEAQKVFVTSIYAKPLETSYSEIIEEIIDLNNKLRPIIFVLDATGVGETPAEILCLSGVPCEPVKLSLPKKYEIMNHLKILLEQGRIRIPDNKELIDQLSLYEYRYEKSQRIGLAAGQGSEPTMKLGAPSGAHDDYVTALALLAWGLKNFYAPASVTVIKRSPVLEKNKVVHATGKLVFCENCDKYHWNKCTVLTEVNQSL